MVSRRQKLSKAQSWEEATAAGLPYFCLFISIRLHVFRVGSIHILGRPWYYLYLEQCLPEHLALSMQGLRVLFFQALVLLPSQDSFPGI